MIASGAPVPLSVIEGVTAQQAEALAAHEVNDIDGLAATTVDDLVEFLDVSLDQAEQMLIAAQAVIQIREQSLQAPGEESETPDTESDHQVEQHAASIRSEEHTSELQSLRH